MGSRKRPGDIDVETTLVLDWNVGVLPSGKEVLVLGDINVGGAACCPSCHLVILSSCQVVGLGAYHIVSLRILELANLFMDFSLYISRS